MDAWLTLAVVVASLSILLGTRIAADFILVGALSVLMIAGVLSPTAALAGLGNPGLVTVGALFIVAAGLVNTGIVHTLGTYLLGRPKSTPSTQLRLMVPVAAASGFLNNTPVVAMLVPVIEDWARRHRVSVSKLMMPLSYAAIMGGSLTLIGTSTNIIINGLLVSSTNLPPMGFFDIGAVGLPCALLGTAFVIGTQKWLLPTRKPPLADPSKAREYVIEMLVEESSPLAGRSVEDGGLRHLPGAFLAEIEREGTVLPAVAPTEIVRTGDRLIFVGAVESVVDLLKLRGLVPAPDQLFKLDAPRPERRLFEVVVSNSCPLVGRTIRDGQFRARYNAVVVAVARNGTRLRSKIGDIRLRIGDTLLLESGPTFMTQQRNSRDFLLVSELQGVTLPSHDKGWIAAAVLLAMVLAVATGAVPMLEAALAAAGAMLVTRCLSTAAARHAVDWSTLTIIGASLGLGQAMQASGAAAAISSTWLQLAGGNPWLALAAVYVMTSAFTAVITNNAAAVLVFPIAAAAASSLHVSLWPFVVVIMMAASASFATPIGYQTNLMVYGPGGYRFADYLRLGLPLTLLLGTVTVTLAPLIWPFTPA
jgi:di/tricarboxylate transporter